MAVEHTSEQERIELNMLYASVFVTTEGQAVLRHLQAVTLDKPVYGPDRAPSSPREESQHAAWRDGVHQ